VTLGRLRLSVVDARGLAEGALRGIGYHNDEARIIADHVIDAAMCGYEYSGLAKILNVFESEHFRLPRRSMKVLRETEVSLAFDGGNNVGMLALFHAAQATIKKTASHGIALVSVTGAWMSGRGAYYVEMIAKHGLVAIHTAASSRLVAPPGGIRPVHQPDCDCGSVVARADRARYGYFSLHDDRGDATRTAWRVTSRRRRARPWGRADQGSNGGTTRRLAAVRRLQRFRACAHDAGARTACRLQLGCRERVRLSVRRLPARPHWVSRCIRAAGDAADGAHQGDATAGWRRRYPHSVRAGISLSRARTPRGLRDRPGGIRCARRTARAVRIALGRHIF